MLGLPYESIFAGEAEIGERKLPGVQLKWSTLHDFPAGQMYTVVQEWVFPFIKGLQADKNSAYSKYMGDAIFKLPTPLVLSKVVDCLDGICDRMAETHGTDIRGTCMSICSPRCPSPARTDSSTCLGTSSA